MLRLPHVLLAVAHPFTVAILLFSTSFASLSCKRAATPGRLAPEVDLTGDTAPPNALWLETLDLRHMTSQFGRGTAQKSVTGNPIRMGGKHYPHGVGTHAASELTVRLDGEGEWFLADVGVDDELSCLDIGDNDAATQFRAVVDGKVTAEITVRKGEPPRRLAADLAGARELRLLALRDGSRFNHVNWGGALLLMKPGRVGAARTVSPGAGAHGKLPPPFPEGLIGTLSADDESLLFANTPPAQAFFLQSLDWTMATGNTTSAGKTDEGKPLRLGGRDYPHGVSVHGEASLAIALDGAGQRFVARIGLNEELDCNKVLSGGAARFVAWIDDRRVFDSGTVRGYDPPLDVNLDLTGAKLLVLDVRLEGPQTRQVWAGATLVMNPDAKTPPRSVRLDSGAPVALAPARLDVLAINGPRIVGASPGRPFLFRIPATGRAPLGFAAPGLPEGLQLDAKTGIISGAITKPGIHRVELSVSSGAQKVTRPLYIRAGENALALTPPMGWNSWNAWGTDVDDEKIRAAARALIDTGLASFGYNYVNIDDAWEGGRDASGNILSNQKFPDMRALGDYIHGLGLRFGIYTSPGPKTCGNYEGSYQHEAQDAATFASWGVDYLKHDWCSYGNISAGATREEAMAPYVLMAKALRATGRDILLSICQYGSQSVWEWGKEAGGHLWRTTGDIIDTWNSVETIGFSQHEITHHGGPGGWNDPDMLVVGHVGWSANLHPTRLTQNEQVTHLSLWSLLAAPLLLGNDLTKLDDFTRALLMNPEVLDVNQDPLGRPVRRIFENNGAEVWARPLFDGTVAVGFFNRSPIEKSISTTLAQLVTIGAHLKDKAPVRDLWRRAAEPPLAGTLTRTVPPHGARLYKVGTPRPELWQPGAN